MVEFHRQVEAGLSATGMTPAAARKFFEAAVGRDAARARMRDAFRAVTCCDDEEDGAGDDSGSEEGHSSSRSAGEEAAALVGSRRIGVDEVAAVILPGGEWAFLANLDPRTQVETRV